MHPADDCSDPQGFGALLARFLEAAAVKYSPDSLPSRRRELRRFVAWSAERDLKRPIDITRTHLEHYRRTLHHHRKNDGQPLGLHTQQSMLNTVQLFFRWLAKHHCILFDPSSEIELPRVPKRLPRAVLSAAEVERVLDQVRSNNPLALRDRAILETLYSTAIRRGELVGLKLGDLDRERGTLRIRRGKGGNERVVPIGKRAVGWIDRYLEELRPRLVAGELEARGSGNFGAPYPSEPQTQNLFLRADGKPITPSALDRSVKILLERSDLSGRGRSHLFRHSTATLMLEGGADIRYIQAMLGHSELTTTQIYTRVSIQKLKAVHTATHPGANLRRKPSSLAADSADAGDDEDNEQ